ncbi:hypothetical protein Pmani_037023 [Petrolisthes manimaculis]|uniref:E3 ubiquitin-protein ligase n=1 Tax=Petrolisthes manimaculis TaxID=1843537 RepID=A0AAE1NK04_9EUCA|nr:hypothetical protein Pmani_037023 [Petrolisthes manimaculis]
MAEAAERQDTNTTTTLKDKSDDNEGNDNSKGTLEQQKEGEEEEEEMECAVCLQKCVHPVRLPCSHIFCFLCVKGVANQSKRCAMCRQEIPADFLDHPTLLSAIEAEKEEVLPGGYQWFYEGRNGWWQYDERTSQELEAAYGSGQRACEVLVAGFLYIIDFDRMVQLRRNDPSRRRRIKRDLSSIPKKGVAGIKLPSQLEAELSALHTAAHAIHIPRDSNEQGDTLGSSVGNNNNNDLCPRTPTAPSNTPQTPHTPSAASSSSTSPDTTDPTHPHHALAPDLHHHHHYHHHLPHHYHHHYHHHHVPPHQHHHPPPHQQQLQIPQALTETPHNQNPEPPPPTFSPVAQASITEPPPDPEQQQQTDLEAAVYQMDQLSLTTDTPEFYPLDSTEDSAEETEQYHLTLSSEEDENL